MMMQKQNLYQIQSRYLQLLDKDSYTAEDLAELDTLPGLLEDKLIQRAYVVEEPGISRGQH